MKYLLSTLLILAFSFHVKASDKDSTVAYTLPDSVKAVQFMAEIKIKDINNSKHFSAGMQALTGSIMLADYKDKRGFSVRFSEYGKVVALGKDVKAMKHGLFYFDYNWETNQNYKLLLSIAADSADKFYLHTAYVFLPDVNKWKMIGTVKVPFWKYKLEQLSVRSRAHKKNTGSFEISQAWCQRSNGAWLNLNKDSLPNPVISLAGHIDSAAQRITEIKLIEDAIASGKTDVKENKDNVYYTIMKEGTGRQVAVSDTVVAFYKGYLFPDGEVFDQTKDSPATFPLNRLIKGWQIGVPLCKVGSKIKLVIPSDMAYSIRTRSAKIPPNSILVFEIEVVDTKPIR